MKAHRKKVYLALYVQNLIRLSLSFSLSSSSSPSPSSSSVLYSKHLCNVYRRDMEIHNGASMAKEKIRVAVIGSGLAGLTAPYLLARDTEKRYSVEIFETVSDQVQPLQMSLPCSLALGCLIQTDSPLI